MPNNDCAGYLANNYTRYRMKKNIYKKRYKKKSSNVWVEPDEKVMTGYQVDYAG